MLALCVLIAVMYPWAYGVSVGVLIAGSCLIQAGVQGTFGVIPAHLNELSPDAIRSLFPGLVYQVGVLVASPAVSIEYVLRDRLGYSWALSLFEGADLVFAGALPFWPGATRSKFSRRQSALTLAARSAVARL
jgi:SHS family lactate transporter-like MFS transporter